ncbi:MAG TPA: gamma-glutamyl-gamma-aminobutyrate hydrolase family protein [Actinomycetes bacterium]|nr:gamma-glutamyl-gamma-aminobutyrate hydrolase family protein [Actinomycetes bacterium]
MRALVVANTGDDDAGYVGERLTQRGYQLDVRHRDTAELPASADGYDLVVMLGSDWSVYWDHVRDDVARESVLVQDAAKNDVPVLGICYGGQLMSHALGGSVEAADSVEIGWFTLQTEDSRLAPPGPWFEYHIDKFTPPPEAQVIATSSAGPQAYRLGRMLALQFHPEVSPEIVRRWGSTASADAEQYGIDFDAVYTESDKQAPVARQRCHGLVDAFLESVAPGTP